MEREKFSYRFEVTNQWGTMYVQEVKNSSLYSELGDDVIDGLCRGLSKLINLMGYPKWDKDMVFPVSITEEEAEYLDGCLFDYRQGKKVKYEE